MPSLPPILFFIAWALLGAFLYYRREAISKVTGLTLYGSVEAAGLIGGFIVFLLANLFR